MLIDLQSLWSQLSSAPRSPLVSNAPQARAFNGVDVLPNLLLTTLSVVALALPPGQQTSASAPQVAFQSQVTIARNLVILGVNALPVGVQVSSSAPISKTAVPLDVIPNLILRGTNQPPPGRGIDLATPSVPSTLQIFIRPNVVLLTAVAATPGVSRLSDSAPYRRSDAGVDAYSNAVLRGTNALPVGVTVSQSAPVLSTPVTVDIRPNSAIFNLLSPALPPGVLVNLSVPVSKSPVTLTTYLNLPLRGTNQPPPGAALSGSAPSQQSIASVDARLNTLLLNPPSVPPPGARLDASAPAAYPVIQIFIRPNLVLGGTNQPPPGAQVSVLNAKTLTILSLDGAPNLLTSTLRVVALPPGTGRIDYTFSKLLGAVQADVIENLLPLGIPVLAPPVITAPPAGGSPPGWVPDARSTRISSRAEDNPKPPKRPLIFDESSARDIARAAPPGLRAAAERPLLSVPVSPPPQIAEETVPPVPLEVLLLVLLALSQ